MTNITPITGLNIPRFATVWILIGSMLCIWDACYVLNRPHSMAGGPLFWAFQPYAKYITLDLLYGNTKNAFVVAQTYVNCLEIFAGLFSIMLYHASRNSTIKNLASLLLLITSVATFCKTVLYFVHDTVDVGIHPDQHPPITNVPEYLFLFLIPNLAWIVMPFFIIVNISRQVLGVCEQVQVKAKKN